VNDYECKACGAPVRLEDGNVLRSCECNAVVIANMQAVARGRGDARGVSAAERLFATLRRIGHAVMRGPAR
jgi:hypothetical protein